MKWIKQIWLKFLQSIGYKMTSDYKKCICNLEERLSSIDDDELLIAIKMLDAEIDCEIVFNTLRIARRKKLFKRKLNQLGIKGPNLEHLLDQYLSDLRGSTKVDDIVSAANYSDTLKKKKADKLNPI